MRRGIAFLLSKGPRSRGVVFVGLLAACSSDGAYVSTERSGETVGRATSALSTVAVTYAGDELRTGWYNDESSFAPATVGGGTFGQLFSAPVSGQVYAQPLVSQGTLFVATEANAIYGFDAISGKQNWSRSFGTPFSSTDIGCSNIAPTIGITGTPVIDSSTNTAYFFSKAYVSGTSGTVAYFAHAVSVATGIEDRRFPVRIEGTAANDSTQRFNAHQQLQRPGLLLLNGVVYAAFGAHCDKRPYTGWIAGVTTTGQLSTLWATQAGPNKADGAGIWMPSALASDGPGQILFVTGNGYGSVSNGPGTSAPATLPESAVRAVVQSDGSLKATDYFSPFDAGSLDGADLDFGSSGPLALPSTTFGTTAFPHLLVTGSKKGYLYLLNRDSLGGRGQGSGGGDALLARLGPFGGAWTKPSAWPGDGGFIYITDASGGSRGNGGVLRAFAYGHDGTGKPTLSLSGTTADAFGYGSGPALVTSNGTASGTALVWVLFSTGPGKTGGELRAYDAVPVNSVLHKRWSAPIGVVSAFSAPGIANGRVYVGTGDGKVLGFGAPVSAAITGPAVTFGAVTVGKSSASTARLTATQALTVKAVSSSNPQFTLGTPSHTLPAALPANGTLDVPVTFTPTAAGLTGGTLDVMTSAGRFAIALSGTGQSSGAQITASAPALSFGGAATNTTQTGSVTFTNTGSAALTISGFSLPSAPFGVSGLPAVGSAMAAGASFIASVTFAPTAVGSFSSSFALVTSAGTATVGFTGSAALPGTLKITPLSLAFGGVTVGSSHSLSFTLANAGGTALTISKSKPPALGQFIATSSLPEGTVIAPGTSLTEAVSFAPTVSGALSDAWILNGDASGLQTVTFAGTAQPSTGSALVLQYLCADTNPTDNSVKPHFNIMNNGDAPVPLSELTIRYWYTLPPGTTSQALACDFAPIGCSGIKGTFTPVSRAHAGQSFDVSFGTAAGDLPAKGQTGEMQLRFHKDDWSAYAQSGDYSFDPTKTTMSAWSHVTLYQNGVLVAGVEPQ